MRHPGKNTGIASNGIELPFYKTVCFAGNAMKLNLRTNAVLAELRQSFGHLTGDRHERDM